MSVAEALQVMLGFGTFIVTLLGFIFVMIKHYTDKK